METGETSQNHAKSIRETASEKYGRMEQLAKDSQVDFVVLTQVESDQITRELAIKFLKSSEKYLREKASQAIHGDRQPGVNDEYYYKQWEIVSDALDGATGKGPVSKTIDYFRGTAKHYDEMITKNNEAIALGPFRADFKKDDESKKKQNETWAKISKNYNTVARLFENQPQIAIAETK